MSDAPLPLLRLLRLSAGSRLVFQTRFRGELAVARVPARPVPLDLDGAVRASVLAGDDLPAGLDPEQESLLAGCRALAGLGPVRGIPDVLAAGVERIDLPGIKRAGRQQGHIHVVTRWIEGQPLAGLAAAAPPAAKLALLRDIARTLERMHAGLVAHGGLAPGNLVVDGHTAWLVEMTTARRVTQRDSRLAGDVLAFGELARSLLAEIDPALAGRWPAAIESCLAPAPAARPTMSRLLADLDLLAGETVQVSDPTAFRRPAAQLDAPTEWVPDPPPPPGSPRLHALLLLAVAFVCVIFSLWNPAGC